MMSMFKSVVLYVCLDAELAPFYNLQVRACYCTLIQLNKTVLCLNQSVNKSSVAVNMV